VQGRDGTRTPRERAGISADRLNAAQPPPPGSPAKPGVAAMGKSARDRTSGAAGGNLPKRGSGLAGQLDMNTPPASTQAQFQNSNANLVNQQARTSPATGALQSNQGRPSQQQEQQNQGFMQKVMKVLCCGTFCFHPVQSSVYSPLNRLTFLHGDNRTMVCHRARCHMWEILA
jgi:casein kinase 1